MEQTAVFEYRVARPIAEAEAAVREALQREGFGILTEIDVAATLKAKLGVETAPHRILGACNPKLAHASLEAEPSIGAFLPCGLALRQGASADETIVSVQNPELLAAVFAVPALAPIASEAATRLRNAMDSVTAST